MARIDRRSAGHVRRTGRPERRRRGAMVGRSLTALALLPLASRLPSYGRLTLDLLADERVSVARKAILAGVIVYAVSPLDLIPDRVPVLGAIDDLVVDRAQDRDAVGDQVQRRDRVDDDAGQD